MAAGNSSKSPIKKDKKSKQEPASVTPGEPSAPSSAQKQTKKIKSTSQETSSKPLPPHVNSEAETDKQKKRSKAGLREPGLKSISAPHTSKKSVQSKSTKINHVKMTTKSPEPSPSPEPTNEEDEAVSNGSEDEEDADEEDMHLRGFSTDDDDSSDDENNLKPGLDITKLPTIAKDDAVVKQKLEKAKRQPAEDRGVLFLGRIPHGFYEEQLKAYFSQFGNVTRLRLSRNKKTGKSKHYAFIEFDSSSVAQIVAETMDNYLLMGHILRCKVLKKDEIHPELWVGANRKWRHVPYDRLARVQHNKPRTEDEQSRAAKRLLKRQNERKRKLAESGIKYDFEAVSYKRSKGTKS